MTFARTLAVCALVAASWLGLGGCAGARVGPNGESARATLARGDREFDARRYGPAAEAYRLATFTASRGSDPETFVAAASQVASVLALQGTPSEARTWLAQAEPLAQPDAPGGWTRFLLARGLVHWKEGDAEMALADFSELYQYCFLHNETARAIQATQMATLVSAGAEQIEWARRGIQAAATTGKAGWEAPLWANLGWLLDTRGLAEEALQAFERSLTLTRRSDATRLGRARAEWAYGHALRKVGRFEDAQRALDELYAVTTGLYVRQRLPEVAEYLGRTLMDLAELDVVAGRHARARERFASARARLIEAGAVDGAPELLREIDQRVALLPRS